jgi:hypothetical protein
MQECREKDTRDDRIFSRGIEKLTLPLIHVGALTKSISPPQVTKTQVLTKGVFEGVARGLGCAPRSPFLCLASSPPPSTRPARAKSPLSAWLPWYAIFHRSVRARLSAALGGRFSGALRRRRVALTASRGRRETSSRPSSSRKPWPIKASAGTSSLLLPSLP